MTLKKVAAQRKPDLAKRVLAAQAELNSAANRWEAMPYSVWLRTMADQRRALAALYREASRGVDPATAEWHAFMDAALSFELHATANDNSAAEHETAHDTAGGVQ